jgi:hypothetical protein
MEILKCHHLLDIPVSYFIKDIDSIPKPPIDKEFHISRCNPKLFLHEDMYNKLSELGDLASFIFSSKPGATKGSIHIDLDTTTLKPLWPGLNIILEGQGTMKWFNPTGTGLVSRLPVGVYFRAWFKNYGEPIDEWNEGKIALVRTDIPHQVWNFDNEARRIVSIRWSNKKTWEETIEWFNRNFPNN